ncbi:MAG TPA: hypothetical protein VJH37_04145 [Candidatus Nanoarchaeia archaeon]|nr:hypothetical protein [Candidatus Nanoarchaeia archaeon]
MKRGIVFLSLLVFVLAGCQGGQQTTNADSPFIGGTQAVEVAFVPNEPPARVLDSGQETFFITLLLKNGGEFTVPRNGLIASLSGLPQKSFNIRSLNVVNDKEISGATKDAALVQPGGEELLEFGEAKYTIDIPASFTTQLRADICYTYQTKAVANLCLKKNVVSRTTVNDVCDVNVPSVAIHNSAGPIQSTDLRQTSVGANRVKVTFKVKNVGTGAVYQPSAFTNICAGQDTLKDMVKVTLTSPELAFTVQCSQLNNQNSGIVRLVNKEKDITCTIDTTGLQDVTFQNLLLLQMDYMYRTAVVTQLTVDNAVA